MRRPRVPVPQIALTPGEMAVLGFCLAVGLAAAALLIGRPYS